MIEWFNSLLPSTQLFIAQPIGKNANAGAKYKLAPACLVKSINRYFGDKKVVVFEVEIDPALKVKSISCLGLLGALVHTR